MARARLVGCLERAGGGYGVCRREGLAAAAGIVLAAGLAAAPAAAARNPTLEQLQQLSIEELANIRVTTVTRTPEPLGGAAASIYVITGEEIRQSGARTLPEALRLAPNLHVAQVDAQSYAISARGFNSFEAAIKLLVMIDGRSIYSPLHAGVFWDQQQVLLDDVERIEVISGPGGTLWGANAMNGVINIVTRHSADTRGGLAGARYGSERKSMRLRYGGSLSDAATARVYGMGFRQRDSYAPGGADARDKWGGRQAGFRGDWEGDGDALTLQGDLYENRIEGGDITGGNVLARWRRDLGGSDLEVQAYYDRVDRIAIGVTDLLETFDLEAQHVLPFGAGHHLVWGGGYRMNKDEFDNRLNPFVLDPIEDTMHLGNVFAQGSIAVTDDLTLTLGSKLEHSSYSGLEVLPNARFAWRAAEDVLLWGAVSKAVRTPSRIDRDLVFPGLFAPGTDFHSEKLIAYELGYRGQPAPRTSLSVTLYYHDYEDLRVLAISPATGLLMFDNKMAGHSYGLEAWADHRLTDRWRVTAGANLMRKSLDLEPDAVRLAFDQHAGNDPEYQLFLRSHVRLTDDLELNVGLRAIDELPNPEVPGYVAVDARLGWQVTDALDLSLAAFNVFDDSHPETGPPATRREMRRSVYLGARWRF